MHDEMLGMRIKLTLAEGNESIKLSIRILSMHDSHNRFKGYAVISGKIVRTEGVAFPIMILEERPFYAWMIKYVIKY